MASGQEHDKATKFWSGPFGLCIGFFFGLKYGLLSGFAFLFGGLWLSPDLDIHSKSLQRWGVLKIIWLPYRYLIRHRSLFSHGPFIGTVLRGLYLSLVILTIENILKLIGFENPFNLVEQVLTRFQKDPRELISIFIGLEASSWLHIIKDKDPLPSEWTKPKKR